MRILVTGATGFIGRPLCVRLLAEGEAVRGTVRAAVSAAKLPAKVDPTTVNSIGPDTDWSEALTEIDTIVHLAARVHVMAEADKGPLAAYRHVNVFGTGRLAEMAAAKGVKRLVFLSSVKVQGEETSRPYTETDLPAPMDPYGISKHEGEEVLRKVAANTGLEVVIIRPPLVYGPGVKANFFHLLSAIERGVPLPLGSVDNARSLIYLGNLINAIIACMKRPQAAGQTFLVSDGMDVSTPELIRQLATALGRSARLFPFPTGLIRLAGKMTGRSAAVDRLLGSLVVNSSKIRRELDWRPPFTMAEGIKDTVAWYKHSIGVR